MSKRGFNGAVELSSSFAAADQDFMTPTKSYKLKVPRLNAVLGSMWK